MSTGSVARLWLLREQGSGALIAVSFFTILTIFPLILLIRVPAPQAATYSCNVQLSSKENSLIGEPCSPSEDRGVVALILYS
ncbi:hypothetical protein ACFFMS_25850 [Ectobacillus funiculus]|uniref:Uncharacterized protein n=1 Tax=Ectobacillus funiculus TaxID=137993 RepID=A0ABV5WM42_9BACI